MGDNLEAFVQQEEDIGTYLFRLDSFLRTIGLDPAPQPAPLTEGATAADIIVHEAAMAHFEQRDSDRRFWLIRVIGRQQVQLLRELCSPDSPADRSFDALCALLRQHLAVSRNKYKQRALFASRRQGVRESILSFSAALRHLAVHCHFQTFVDESLQTQFRNGLRSEKVRELLEENYDNFPTLVNAAVEIEAYVAPPPVKRKGNYIFKKSKKACNCSPYSQSAPFNSHQKQNRKSQVKQPYSGYEQQHQNSMTASVKVKCYNCNGYGHFSKQCPSPRGKNISQVPVHPSAVRAKTDYASYLKKKFQAVFTSKTELIKDSEVNLRLKTDAVPVFYSSKSVPWSVVQPTKEAIDSMVQKRYWTKCPPGPWGSPVVCVRKAGGKIRVCGDYSATVNPQLEISHLTKPAIDNLSAICGKVFTSLYFTETFQHLKLSERSKAILALSTPWGTFQPETLQYGVNVAPEEFRAVVTQILYGGPDKIFIYFDNVLIWGDSSEECKRNLEWVLFQFKAHNIHLSLEKCEFLVPQVKYLGAILDAQGLHQDPKNLEALKKGQRPSSVQELKAFIGLVDFYREHISSIVHPLNPLCTLLQKSVWTWGLGEEAAYEGAVEEIGKALVPYLLTLPIRLTCGASKVGVSAVISHIFPDGLEKPVAFASKTLSSTELQYPQCEKEAITLIFGVKKFVKFLRGRAFEIVCDKKALVTLFDSSGGICRTSSDRLLRWGLFLSGFKYKISYAVSSKIPHADGLSQLPLPDATPVENSVHSEMSLFAEGYNLRGSGFVIPLSPVDQVLKLLHNVQLGTDLNKIRNFCLTAWENVDKNFFFTLCLMLVLPCVLWLRSSLYSIRYSQQL